MNGKVVLMKKKATGKKVKAGKHVHKHKEGCMHC